MTTTTTSLPSSLDEVLGNDLALDLAIFMEKMAKGLQALVSPTTLQQIQATVNKFLFHAGMQELRLLVGKDATQVQVTHAQCDTKSGFPVVNEPGDMDVLSHFFTSNIVTNKTQQQTVNQLKSQICVAGMVPLPILARCIRDVCKLATTLNGASSQSHANELLQAMGICFSHAKTFFSDLINLDTAEIDLVDVQHGYRGEIRAEINMDKIQSHYPALDRLLSHLADYEIAILDAWVPPTPLPRSTSELESHLAQGKCMMTIRIMHRGGAIQLAVTTMIAKTTLTGQMLWFDRTTRLPCCDENTKLAIPIEFQENTPGCNYKFRILIKGTFRIPQLGCSNIPLPLLVLEMRYRSSHQTYPHPYSSPDQQLPATKLDITMLHMTQNRFTSLLIRPFFNLDLLRYVLLNHMRIVFEINPQRRQRSQTETDAYDVNEDAGYYDVETVQQPPTTTEQQTLISKHAYPVPRHFSTRRASIVMASAWHFNINVLMMMPPPPRIITSCLGTFVSDQLASPDSLRLVIDMLQNFAVDLKGVASRLSAKDGKHEDASIAEAEKMLQEKQVEDYRQKLLAAIREKERRRRHMCHVM